MGLFALWRSILMAGTNDRCRRVAARALLTVENNDHHEHRREEDPSFFGHLSR